MSKHPAARLAAPLCFLAAMAAPADARTWTDGSGQYTVEADLVAYTDDSVILQRGDRQLAIIEVQRLSQADKDFLNTEAAKLAADQVASKPQTWTTRGGVSLVGRVVDYTSKQVVIQRKRGKVYVNDRVLGNLPGVYQKIVPKIVGNFEKNAVSDEKSLEAWLVHRKGAPASYQCDGVVLAFPNGDEYTIPFFLLSDEDLELLQPGWDQWLAAADDHASRENAATELQSLAAAHQQDAQVNQQIARLQLGMQAVGAGLTSLWEVTLYPNAGVAGPPLWVVAPGRDSLTATNYALNKNPGYTAGSVRRVSN